MHKDAILNGLFENSVSSDVLSVRLSDLQGWDSLAMVRLVVRIEERLDLELSEGDIAALGTVGDVVRILSRTKV